MLIEKIDKARLELSPTLEPKRRSKLGQFMTPGKIAELMASTFGKMPKNVRLLDAGAGMGSLTAAFVLEACRRQEKPLSIDVTTYEIDEQLALVLEDTLSACSDACTKAGIIFNSRIVREDYILHSTQPLLAEQKTFNCAILNPPYGKINASSKWRSSLRTIGIETVNLYTAFVAIALQQMEPRGEIVAITPRSFCNGSYYESFRHDLLGLSALLALHVFESRRTAFKDDNVLQENIIFHLKKDAKQSSVALSTDTLEARDVPFSEIVRPNDRHSFIRLPILDNDLSSRIQTLPATLEDLGLKVSTGRVVDFRVREYLRKMPEDNTVPLIYPSHFDSGAIRGPIVDFKKFNAIDDIPETEKLIVPAGAYVLTKRFSSKEEKRRLVAAVYEGGRVGFENHLNYFHFNGQGLPPLFARGLANFLNSRVVDEYFRIFSGHTQVNANDLRSMHYPTAAQIEALANADDIDKAVEALF